MTRDEIAQALNEIDDHHISEASQPQRKRFPSRRVIGWIAAAAAFAIVISILANPLITSVSAVSTAQYPKYERNYQDQMHKTAAGLADFFTASMKATLSGDGGDNQTYSPINLYMALCLASELSGGDAQILSLLGVSDGAALREQANAVWNACYLDQNNHSLLANSLWLDESLEYNQGVMDLLAEHYYTSVYQGNLGSGATNRAIAAWLNGQTGSMLKQNTDRIALDPDTVLALYSTVYFQAKWTMGDEFNALQNTRGLFHSPSGDRNVTFMNQKEMQKTYYWGEDFGAIALNLRDGSRMWLILPDEDKTVEDVLASGEYGQVLFGTALYENSRYMKVNLSLPKFDIRAAGDLKEDLQELGISSIFDPQDSGLTHSVTGRESVWLTGVNQATRVAIDEKGVTAASYIELPGAGAAPPPEEIIDFILDRPFLFVITNTYHLPLFAGVVNEP